VRSEMFSRVVWALATAGHSLDEIEAGAPDAGNSKYSSTPPGEEVRQIASASGALKKP
jgi:hypothetical protein